MLKIKSLTKYDERHHIQRGIDIRNETLVVADLHTKLEVQRSLLNQQSFLEENVVLRAHELWIKILLKMQIDMRVISPTLARSLIMKWLEKDDIPWARTMSAAANVFRYIQQLLPILCNESSCEIMKQWFESHPSVFIRWGNWFNLSFQYWSRFNSLKLIPSPWVSAYLVNVYKGQNVWDRKMIFDLWCDLTPVESDLLQQMQKNHEIEIVKPAPPWASEYVGSLLGYHFLESKSLDGEKSDENSLGKTFKPRVQFLRFSTMVSEIKAVTSKVRQWLDSGIGPNEITVLAPDIEIYWTVFRLYFEQEGIPVEKPTVTPLISNLEISRWLSVLRLKSGKTSYEDLEMAKFAGSRKPGERFEIFRRMFKNIYGREDLKRLQRIDREFASRLNGNSVLQRDEFVVSSLKFWDGDDIDSFRKLYDCLFQDSPPSLRLKLNQWIMYVEELCARIEIKTVGTPRGIKFTNIHSGPNCASKYIYIIGFSESGLKSQGGTSIELDEVLRINRDTGFIIDFPDNKKIEFESRWLLDGDFKEVFVSFSSSDFSGAVEGAASLWLQGAMNVGLDSERIKYPDDSRWDEIQLSSMDDLKQIREWNDEYVTNLNASLLNTFGKDKKIRPREKPSLSVTQLENYSKCPFIFAARKLFHLDELPDVDMDVDNLTKGLWMHSIFKELIETPFRKDYTESDIIKVIESCCKLGNQVNNKIWEFVWPSLLEMAKRFIVSEVELRNHFPKLHTVGKEVSIEADWDLKNGTLTARGSGDYEFNGSIDRVDTNGGTEASVVDYKSSGGNLRNFKSWVNGDSFQLVMYSQAIEKGLTELGPHEVCSAFYYVSKDMSREKGFRMKDRGGDLFEAKGPSCAGQSEIQGIQNQIMSRVQEIVQGIDEGYFEPIPKDKKLCRDCHWRNICRAPHLN